MKTNKHCGNCDNLGSRFTGPVGALYEHRICKEKNIGWHYDDDNRGRTTVKCVCHWADTKSKPRGCPGWKRRTI